MKRDLIGLSRPVYDLLVVGGGIYGAWVAWDAVLRGLRVALIDKNDFGSQTSANSLKIIHGGFRQLQYGDLRGVRESVRERGNLMRIAPHLVHPLPVLLPTGGTWLRSKGLLRLALGLNDAIGLDRNRGSSADKFIPAGKTISRSECLRIAGVVTDGAVTGGIVFHDAQVSNTERLLLSILTSAARAGATLANYVEASGFLRVGSRVRGVTATDVLSGDRFEIQASTVVVTCGPWLGEVLDLLRLRPAPLNYAAAMNVITRPLSGNYAVGVPGVNGFDNAKLLGAQPRPSLFITPWRGFSIVGTYYRAYSGSANGLKVSPDDVRRFLDQINQSCPAADLKLEDVRHVHAGLLPCNSAPNGAGGLDIARRAAIWDHARTGLQGLFSVSGVKYTTARLVAERTIDRIFLTRRQTTPKPLTSVTPIHGGNVGDLGGFVRSQARERPAGLSHAGLEGLIGNAGSAYAEVLKYVDAGLAATNESAALLRAQVLHGIRDEMACKLSDLVFRRTDVGSAGYPGMDALRSCAELMSGELNWSRSRTLSELDETLAAFQAGGCRQIAG